jgi:hypothetical protein
MVDVRDAELAERTEGVISTNADEERRAPLRAAGEDAGARAGIQECVAASLCQVGISKSHRYM